MRLNGARAICQSLVEEGVSTIFGLPGGAIMPLYDVLPEFAQLHHILVRHEQCAGHMADGYARAAAAIKKPQDERTVGVCFGTSGPGATNLVTGICNAHMDSVPLVAITANVPNSMIGTDAFQEADITGITIPITKQNYFVRDGRDLPRVIREAFHLARTGRPGPVHVDVPKDVLLNEIEWKGYPTSVDLPGYQPTLEPNMRQVKEAARLIDRAPVRRPEAWNRPHIARQRGEPADQRLVLGQRDVVEKRVPAVEQPRDAAGHEMLNDAQVLGGVDGADRIGGRLFRERGELPC